MEDLDPADGTSEEVQILVDRDAVFMSTRT
jgi:hypothetical protein